MSLSRPTNFNSVDQVDHVAASSSHFRRNFSRKNIQESLVPPPIQPYGGRSSRSDPFSTISSRDDQSSERQSRPHHGSRLHDPYTERSSRPDHGSVIQDLFNARTLYKTLRISTNLYNPLHKLYNTLQNSTNLYTK